MEYIEDSSDSEDVECSEWFVKKPFDPNDFREVIIFCVRLYIFISELLKIV